MKQTNYTINDRINKQIQPQFQSVHIRAFYFVNNKNCCISSFLFPVTEFP